MEGVSPARRAVVPPLRVVDHKTCKYSRREHLAQDTYGYKLRPIDIARIDQAIAVSGEAFGALWSNLAVKYGFPATASYSWFRKMAVWVEEPPLN